MFWDLSFPFLSLPIPWTRVKVSFSSPMMCPLLQIIHVVGRCFHPCTFSSTPWDPYPGLGD